MRFLIALRHTQEGVEGEVTIEEQSNPVPFSSWLDLLRLLETHDGESPSATPETITNKLDALLASETVESRIDSFV